MPKLAMVHVDDPRGRWSVHASRVVRIVQATDWRAAPPVDVLSRLGPVPGQADTGSRVLVVRGASDRETALVAAGPIRIGDVDPGDVLALPAVLTDTTPQISAIIVASDASLSLLLELAAVTTFDDTVVGEDLCPSRS
jgi:hypothetical protein